MKALKAERVLKGQMMTDSWAVIKKRRNLKWSESYRTHTHTHTSLTFYLCYFSGKRRLCFSSVLWIDWIRGLIALTSAFGWEHTHTHTQVPTRPSCRPQHIFQLSRLPADMVLAASLEQRTEQSSALCTPWVQPHRQPSCQHPNPQHSGSPCWKLPYSVVLNLHFKVKWCTDVLNATSKLGGAPRSH